MNFRKLLGTAGVTALACLGGTALAANAPTVTLPASGATATDITLADVYLDVVAGLCQEFPAGDPLVVEVYTTGPAFNISTATNYAVVCRTRATVTGIGSTDVAFTKHSSGSGQGVANVANATPLGVTGSGAARWVDFAACKAAVAPAFVAATATRIAHNLYVNCGTAVDTIPRFGIADVEPVLLGASSADRGRLTTRAGVAVGFSPVVTRGFYTALKGAQDLAGACPSDTQAAATEACLPNLTSAQIRGLFKGTFISVNRLYDGAIPLANPAGGGNIFVCRRGNSSGTQVSFQTYFLGQGCGSAHTFVGATTASCTAGGCAWDATLYGNDRVFAGSGTGDVRNCLDFHESLNRYAIGVVSTENIPNDTNRRFRYVKVDGVAPSLERTVSAEYGFFTENSFNTPNATSPNVPTAQQTALTEATFNGLRSASAIRNSVATLAHGLGGVLAIPGNINSSVAPVHTQAAILATPINSQTRALSYGGGLNNCNPPWTAGRTEAAADAP
jgi:hypothetical protein